MRLPLLALALLSASASAAPEPTRIDITLSSFRYAPQEIRLKHGVSYVLRFVNVANGGHDFVAKRFFSQAQLADPSAVEDGAIEVGAGETRDVRIVAPPPGRYAVHCSHFLHSTFGMKGEIVVE